MKKLLFFFLAICMVYLGCATWVNVGGNYTMDPEKITLDLPKDWKKYNYGPQKFVDAWIPQGWKKFEQVDKPLVITRDGISIQQIRVARVPINQELKITKKKLSKDMLPHEVADLIKDNILSNPDIMNSKIIDNIPAKLGGYSGYKLIYTFQGKNGLTYKTVDYGFIQDEWYYYLIYVAPNRYYFAQNISDFEKIKDSFRLGKMPKNMPISE